MDPSPNSWRVSWPFSKGQTVALVAVVLASTGCWALLYRFNKEIFRENGPMENFQAALMVLAAFIFMVTAFGQRDRGKQVLYCGLLLLSVTFFIMEVDVRRSGNVAVIFWLRGFVRDLWLSAVWGLAAILFLMERRATWSAFLGWLFTRAGVLMMLSGGFWVLAGCVDKLAGAILGPFKLMVEETVEVNAALFLFASAFLSYRILEKEQGTRANQVETAKDVDA